VLQLVAATKSNATNTDAAGVAAASGDALENLVSNEASSAACCRCRLHLESADNWGGIDQIVKNKCCLSATSERMYFGKTGLIYQLYLIKK
jgi:hypothetical protein